MGRIESEQDEGSLGAEDTGLLGRTMRPWNVSYARGNLTFSLILESGYSGVESNGVDDELAPGDSLLALLIRIPFGQRRWVSEVHREIYSRDRVGTVKKGVRMWAARKMY